MTRIEALRREKGMSRYRLSMESGVSQSYIRAIERGERTAEDATVKKLKALAAALGTDFTELIGQEKA